MRTPIILALGTILIGITLIFSPSFFDKCFPKQAVVMVPFEKKVIEYVDRPTIVGRIEVEGCNLEKFDMRTYPDESTKAGNYYLFLPRGNWALDKSSKDDKNPNECVRIMRLN